MNDYALRFKNSFSEFTYNLNSLFIKQNLLLNNELSLFFITNLSVKRTDWSPTYLLFLHAFIIDELINKNDLKEIIFVGCSDYFINLVTSKISIPFKEIRTHQVTEQPYLKKSLKFLIKTLIISICVRWPLKPKYSLKRKRLYYSVFPLFFKRFGHDDRYGNIVQENQDDLFFVEINSNMTNQPLPLREYFKVLKEHQKLLENKIVLDTYLRPFDVIITLVQTLIWWWKTLAIAQNSFYFEGFNITPFVKRDIKDSMSVVPSTTVYEKAIVRALLQFPCEEFHYTMFEYAHGRFYTYVLAKYFPGILKVAYQHGPCSQRRLANTVLPRELVHTYQELTQQTMIAPDQVMAEDPNSQTIYTTYGYKNVQTMKQLSRIDYISEITRNPLAKSALIAPILHDGAEMVHFAIELALKSPENKIFFKPHPRSISRIKKILSNLTIPKNMEIVEDDIKKYLALSSEVYFTSSSVGLEAYLLGIPTTMILLNSKVNESLFLDYLPYNPEKKYGTFRVLAV